MKDIEVIFHHFENDDEKKTMNYVYRLIEKGYKKRFGKIYIHASDEEQATLIDAQLWTFRQESFIPHSMLEDKNNNAPISIGCETLPDINLQRMTHRRSLLEKFDGSVSQFNSSASVSNLSHYKQEAFQLLLVG